MRRRLRNKFWNCTAVTTPKRIFQLIDLDRTLFDTARFARLITEEINKLQPGFGDELELQFEAAYKKEETFFMLRFLRQRFGDTTFKQMVQRVVDREGAETFLLPHAKKRLDFADSISDITPSWGILTYGDPVDQHMKISVIGLSHAPLYIAETPDKGALIASWRQADGTFRLPESLTVESVDVLTFEDDKLRAFQGLPEEVTGIWITQYEDAHERMEAAKGIPESVVPAKNLLESKQILDESL